MSEKKIASICRRLEKIAKEIEELGLVVHVNNNLELLEEYNANTGKGEVVATAYVYNWSGGDS